MNRHNPADDPLSSDPDDFTSWERSVEEKSPPTPAYAQAPAETVSKQRKENAAASFAANHDLGSFEILYKASGRKVFGAVLRAGVDFNDVEDVVNIAFAAVWKDRASIREHTYKQFVCFVVRIAKHRAVDWHRSHGWWKNNAFLADNPEEHCVGDDDADNGATGVDEIAAGREAMRGLTEEQREVLEAKAAGMIWEEIAEEMGVSVGAVRRIYDAAMRRMGAEG